MITLRLQQIRVLPGQRILLEAISWHEFEAIVEELGERGREIAMISIEENELLTRVGPDTPMGELLPGTLDMLILKALSHGEHHGYGVAEFIQRASADVLRVEEGALYPALHRLEVRGWLKSSWGLSDNNRRAKYYRLSALGRRELDRESDYWARVAGAVTRVMQTA